jgi:hypothetical protein
MGKDANILFICILNSRPSIFFSFFVFHLEPAKVRQQAAISCNIFSPFFAVPVIATGIS